MMPPSDPPRAILFANPRSGRTRRWLFPIIEALQDRGIELIATHFDLTPHSLRMALERAREEALATVLVAGGDGTVGSFLPYLVHTDFTLGVLPTGTSNDFARSLLIPMSVTGAADVIAQNRPARVDVGEVGGRLFAHSAIVGLNAVFAERVQQLRKVVGRVSYPLAALDAYRQRHPFHTEIRTDEGTREFSAYQVAFANAPVYGGLFELEVAEVDLTDRSLRVLVVESVAFGTILRALLLSLRGKQLRLKGLESYPIHQAQIVTPHPMPVTIDGELEGHTPALVRVVPAALRVYVPPAFLAASRA